MKVSEALARLEAISLKAETRAAMAQEQELAIKLNRAQLLRGLSSTGGQLLPKYSEDPYFKTKAAALHYARWKHKINPLAPYDAPTLFINGYTHSHILMTLGDDKATLYVDGTVEWAAELETKYRGLHLGLNPDSHTKYRKVIFPVIHRSINRKLRGK